MKIKKRDGRVVAFDQNKIIDAVLAAFNEVDGGKRTCQLCWQGEYG